MGYEKKYNDLVNDLKELWNGHTNDSQLLGELAEICPELRESEDERIRRTLVEYFGPQVQLDFVRGVPIQKIRDWLEKQKEKKPAEPTGKLSREEYLYQLLIDQLITYSDYEYLTGKKPAEWSEEDEKMRNLIVAIFEVNHPDGFFKANELGTTDMRGVHTEEIISWLKSLRPSWKPSEEQIYSLGTVVKGYDECTVGSVGYHLKEMYDELKKLM